ncbi:MAG TPA: tetratricopeptide repeat protein [Nevskiaceae bacterium]|nr:tetratricopeptide repeat protein [Nevskiaceae bacterium]
MKRAAVIALAALPLAAAAASTVGELTPSGARQSGGHVLVQTPTILRLAPSAPVAADAHQAIEHYDEVIRWSDDPAIRAEALRRAAWLRLAEAEASGDTAASSELHAAVELYRRALADYPGDAANDRALYQLAHAYQLLGEPQQASDALQALTRAHPQSLLAMDAHFRAGELLYLQQRYREAGAEYAVVVADGRARYRLPSLYKYAWSLYRQRQYEDALAPFLELCAAYLPAGEFSAELRNVPAAELDLAQDALRMSALSLATLGPDGMARYFAARGNPPYGAALYLATAAALERMQRYTDAADTYAAYAAAHVDDPRGPDFQDHAIVALLHGGFGAQAVTAKTAYVERYAPDGAAWKQRALPPPVAAQLRRYAGELALYHRALGQQAQQRAEFDQAASLYARLLRWFPDDPSAAAVNFSYAETLLDEHDEADAAREYAKTAYGYPRFERSEDAAYAAVQVYRRLGDSAPAAARDTALRQSVAAGLQLASTFAQHPHRTAVMAQLAGDELELRDYDKAAATAALLLDGPQPLAAGTRADLLGVAADAQFALGRYPDSETQYTRLLAALDRGDARAAPARERLAESIYRQAEQARAAGDQRLAAAGFQRVGATVPDASIRASADYDAAAALIQLQDWPAASGVLEGFVLRNPKHALLAQADRKLAWAYQNAQRPAPAAAVYQRIAQRDSEPADVRMDAAWQAAALYRQAHQYADSAAAYRYYLASFAPPPERRLQALRELADLSHEQLGDEAGYRRWLGELIAAAGAAARGSAAQLMAANAALELGRAQAADAQRLTLRDPLERSLKSRLGATSTAVDTLTRAAGYGLVEVTPAASYAVGQAYSDFAGAMLTSERPAKLSGDARQQYDLLLEEQADPFEQKAIHAHEGNLARIEQGVWDRWVGASVDALGRLAPARYGKHENNETSYDSLK